MRFKYNLTLIILLVTCFAIIGTSRNIGAGELSSIPLERMNTKGDYDPNALAKKLAQALEQDAILSAFKSNQDIYVAQSGSKIILKGRVREGDQSTIQRITNIAYNIEGVTEVDTSQLQSY